MSRLRTAFKVLVCFYFVSFLSSWIDGGNDPIGPIPQAPDYTDSTQWLIVNRGGKADLFYVISTETGDHLMGSDTCHYADTYDAVLRSKMLKEMHAVDSFYSGSMNYYSPYYRQVSMQSWATEKMAMTRIPLALSDVMRSWEYYLAHYNQGRPFILAGFSQGAHAMMSIMRNMPDSVASRMVAAYAVGYKVTQEDLDASPHIKAAQGATDTGVTICFNSVKSPDCEVDIVSKGNLLCINPVNWRTDSTKTTFVNYGRRKNDTLTVQLHPESRLLLVEGYQERSLMSVIGRPGNYHQMELRFYYPYIRQNMADRVAAYLNSSTKL